MAEVPAKMYCYCDASKRKLREWLRNRYGTLEKATKSWYRYSYETWDDVEPPRSFSGYADSLDWLQFRIDNAFSLFDWRVKLFASSIRTIGDGAWSGGDARRHAICFHNEWRSAAEGGYLWTHLGRCKKRERSPGSSSTP